MYRFVAIFAVLLGVVYGQTDVSQCTRNTGDLPNSVHIAGCTTPPCGLPQLQDAVIDIEFTAPRDINTMTTHATAYLFAIGIPYPLGENAVTCNSLQNASCPVKEGQVVRYQLRMFIESFFPVGVAPTIEFRIVDEAQQPVICLRVPIRIEPPVASLH